MSVSSSDLRDPEPHAAPQDLTGLGWERSWDCALIDPVDDGYGAPADLDLDLDLDAELAALLDSVRRLEAGDPSSEESAGTGAEDAELAGVLAQLVERTEAALAAESAAGSAGGPLSGWSDAAIVAEAARLERLTRWATARGYQLIEELAQRRPDPSGAPDERGLSGYAVDEVALAVGITRWAACKRVAEADALTRRHPQLLLALSAGCLTPGAVTRVLETTAVLDPDQCAVVERHLLDRAGRPVLPDLGTATAQELSTLTTEQVMAVSVKATPAYVGRVTRDLVQRLDPGAARRREATAKAGRSVGVDLAADGMAWLTAHLPAAAAIAAYEHIDALAHTLPTHSDGDTEVEPDPRSMDAKRADVLTSLLLGAAPTPDEAPTPPAPIHIHVTIDARQHASEPRMAGGMPGGIAGGMAGEIARLGPVTTDTLRDLLDLTQDTAGAVDGAVAVDQPCPGHDVHQLQGPGPYQPPERVKNLLRVRHRTCIFPGCTHPSRHCELDHTRRYPDGPTCECNLAPLCIHHHHLKHHAPHWTLTNHGHGHLTWTTPTGRHIHVGEGPAPPDHRARPPGPREPAHPTTAPGDEEPLF